MQRTLVGDQKYKCAAIRNQSDFVHFCDFFVSITAIESHWESTSNAHSVNSLIHGFLRQAIWQKIMTVMFSARLVNITYEAHHTFAVLPTLWCFDGTEPSRAIQKI